MQNQNWRMYKKEFDIKTRRKISLIFSDTINTLFIEDTFTLDSNQEFWKRQLYSGNCREKQFGKLTQGVLLYQETTPAYKSAVAMIAKSGQ